MNENNSDTEEKSSTKGRPFVLGLLSLVFGLMGFVTPFLAVIGIVLGIVGLVKKNRKALCILGLIFSLLAFLVSAGRSSRNTGTISSTGSDPEQSETAVSEATSAQQTTVTDNRKKAATSDSGEENAAEEVSVSADDFEIKEYPYENSIGDTLYYLVITNHSDQTVSVFGNATAKDAAGATIGAADCTVDVLGPGEQTITYFYFSGVQGVDHVDYQLSYQVTNTWKPVLSDLSTDVSINNENVVVAVTNNGTEPADFVHVYALFYDAAGNVVNVDSSYTIDDDSELKAGATLSAQLNSYKAFDHVEVYLTGRR